MLGTLALVLDLFRLQRIPAAPPALVQRLQTQRLRNLVRQAVARSPHFRAKYADLDLDHFVLTDLPPSNKGELMAHFDDAVTDGRIHLHDLERFLDDPANLGRWYLGQYAISHTSGSQGQPFVIVQDRRAVELLFRLQIARGNVFSRIGIGEALRRLLRRARLALVAQRPGFYPTGASFAYFPQSLQPFVQVRQFSAIDPDVLDQLNAYRPDVLIGYTSVLHKLALQADRLQLRPTLRQVVNVSEVLTEQARQRIQQAFGVPVLDCYAVGECPFLTHGCPVRPGMHVNADVAILEVVDEKYRPVPAGQLGTKVLVTNLANYVQPIIRYEIGDRVLLGREPCGCGSRLPYLAAVEGRTADEFWIEENGQLRSLPQSFIKNAVDFLLNVREWQAIQEERNRLRICLEPLPGKTLDRETARRVILSKWQRLGVAPQVQIDVDIVPELRPDPHTGKFRRIVKMIEEPAAIGSSP